jgi:hypothetical protein
MKRDQVRFGLIVSVARRQLHSRLPVLPGLDLCRSLGGVP